MLRERRKTRVDAGIWLVPKWYTCTTVTYEDLEIHEATTTFQDNELTIHICNCTACYKLTGVCNLAGLVYLSI